LARRLLDADAAMRRCVFIGNLMVTRKKRVVGRLIHFFSAPVRSTSSGHASWLSGASPPTAQLLIRRQGPRDRHRPHSPRLAVFYDSRPMAW